MSRKFKTSQRKRTNYIYSTAEEVKIVITLGVGVTETDIELLHSMDDIQVDEHRRYNYRVPTHLDAYHDGEALTDRNKYLADNTTNPEKQLIEAEEEAEHQDLLDKLSKGMEVLTLKEKDLIKKKFVDNKTNVAIAAERNVSETTIRKDLKKLYRKLKNNLIND